MAAKELKALLGLGVHGGTMKMIFLCFCKIISLIDRQRILNIRNLEVWQKFHLLAKCRQTDEVTTFLEPFVTVTLDDHTPRIQLLARLIQM